MCHKNESLYQVLQLDKQILIKEIKEYPKKFRIDEQIRELIDNIKLDYDINIITPDAGKMLHTLANSKLNDINFPAYSNVVSSLWDGEISRNIVDRRKLLVIDQTLFTDGRENDFYRFNAAVYGTQ